MIARLLLVLLAILAMVWLGRWISSAQASERRRRIRQLILWALAAVLIILALTGRLNWIAALFAALLPLASRLWSLVRYFPFINHLVKRHQASRRASTGNSRGGQASQVETRFIRMTLDHDSGEINGRVITGQYSGQSLASLSEAQLTALYQYYLQEDAESSRLLAAYLEQRLGPGWHEAEHAQRQSPDDGRAAMTKSEALAILGLDDTATRQDIVDSHRRLMQKLHPDRGGSDYLATKINVAKDTLLGQDGETGRA